MKKHKRVRERGDKLYKESRKWNEPKERVHCLSEKSCSKMPANTKEQVFGGLRFQAEGADRVTGMLTFNDDKGEPVCEHHVFWGDMRKREKHY